MCRSHWRCSFFWRGTDGNDEGTNDGNSGNTGEEDSSGDNDTEYDTFIVSEMPGADSIWGYFYVWQTTSISSTEAEAIIIAPEQWYTLAADALDLLDTYSEDGIEGWRMFTTEEATAFRNQFQGSVSELNEFISEYGLAFFKYSDGARYLCNNAQSTFSFANNRIIDAGRTVKYYLRPVKKVRFKLK